MKKILITILLALMPVAIFGLRADTAIYMPLTNSVTNLGSYTTGHWYARNVTWTTVADKACAFTLRGFSAAIYDRGENESTGYAPNGNHGIVELEIYIPTGAVMTDTYLLGGDYNWIYAYSGILQARWFCGGANHIPTYTYTRDVWFISDTTFDGTYWKSWVNGVEKGSLNCSTARANKRFSIGYWDLGSTFTGNDCYVRMFRVQNNNYAGETLPITDDTPTVTPTYTGTQTHTVSPTFTATPTVTPKWAVQVTVEPIAAGVGTPVNIYMFGEFIGNTRSSFVVKQSNNPLINLTYDPTPVATLIDGSDRYDYFYVDGSAVNSDTRNGDWYDAITATVWFSETGFLFDIGYMHMEAGGSVTYYLTPVSAEVTVFPTSTLTHTVTETSTLTETVTNTYTDTPTDTHTLTSTLTSTLTPTLTQTNSITPTFTISPTFVVHCAEIWQAVTPVTPWTERDKFQAITSTSDIWVIGGTRQDINFFNDAYSSNNGADWTVKTRNAEYQARASHNVFYYDSKLWVTAGLRSDPAAVLNDVWYSSDGIAWGCTTTAAAFPARKMAASVVFDNKMWIISGSTQAAPNNYGNFNDVWYSTNGKDWTAATRNAQFTNRRNATAVVFKNKMWLIGGILAVFPLDTYLNDVWNTSDGVSWTRITARSGFAGSDTIYAFVKDNKINVYIDNLNEVWSSSDGVKWTKLKSTGVTPTARRESGKILFGNYLFTFGGYGDDYGPADTTDTWKADVNKCIGGNVYDDDIKEPWEY